MIRKIVTLWIVLVMVLIVQTTFAGAADEAFKLLRNSMLRKSPSVDSPVIIELHTGASGKILETKGNGNKRWYRVVTTSGSTGWIIGSNISVVADTKIVEGPGLKKAGALSDNKEIRKIDELSTDMETALAALRKDNAKILSAMEGLISKKCAYEAKKQAMEISLVSGNAKETGINSLSNSIDALYDEIRKLIELYKQQNVEIALLSEKIIEAGQHKQALTEMYAVLKVVKPEEPIPGSSLVTTSASEVYKLLQKTTESFGSVGKTGSQTAAMTDEEGKTVSAQSAYAAPVDNKETARKQVGAVPRWITDLLSAKGRKINSEDYGPMTVAEDNGLTVMTVTAAYNDRYKDAFKNFIKESYQAEDLVYHVIGNMQKK